MNYDDSSWRDHRDELLERVVHRGRARKRRRALGIMSVALAVILAIAAGVYVPNRDNHSLHVANNVAPATTVPPRTGVLLIGDQVMLGAKSVLEHAIPEAHVDAAVSRQFDDAIPAITTTTIR